MKEVLVMVLVFAATLTGCAAPMHYSQAEGLSRGDAFTTEVNASSRGEKLGEFGTDLKNAKKARAHNIALAASKIDGAVIEPGKEFSYNETVGPTTKNNGFKLGMIFISGEKSEGYGGGVCQVSSTLFNAAEKAGMEITERNDHSRPVGYVEPGRDAATSYGVIDFKFVNPREKAVEINAFVKDERIICEIYVRN